MVDFIIGEWIHRQMEFFGDRIINGIMWAAI